MMFGTKTNILLVLAVPWIAGQMFNWPDGVRPFDPPVHAPVSPFSFSPACLHANLQISIRPRLPPPSFDAAALLAVAWVADPVGGKVGLRDRSVGITHDTYDGRYGKKIK